MTTIEVERGFVRAAAHLPRILDLADRDVQIADDFELAYEQDPPDEDALARIAAEFEGNEAMVIAKLENYIGLDQKFTMIEQAFKARAAELRELAGIAERNRERLRARLLVAMKTMGRDKIVTPSGIVSIRLNNPAVQIDNEPVLARVEGYETMPDVPAEFVRLITLYKVSKHELLAHIKATGEVVDGVEISRTESLRIS